MEKIRKYFPDLTGNMLAQIGALNELYRYWNARINVVSRKDIDCLMERHVLHSLSIARILNFSKGTRVMDAGTGGGFPGIPLAIVFPDTEFLLVDSIGKKIGVVREISSALGLKNIRAVQIRVEQVPGVFDFVVSRAVTTLHTFIPWVKARISSRHNNDLPNGILYLKGGDLDQELRDIHLSYRVYDIHDQFPEPFFETKKIVHIFW